VPNEFAYVESCKFVLRCWKVKKLTSSLRSLELYQWLNCPLWNYYKVQTKGNVWRSQCCLLAVSENSINMEVVSFLISKKMLLFSIPGILFYKYELHLHVLRLCYVLQERFPSLNPHECNSQKDWSSGSVGFRRCDSHLWLVDLAHWRWPSSSLDLQSTWNICLHNIRNPPWLIKQKEDI
jgi:hypothetical protein